MFEARVKALHICAVQVPEARHGFPLQSAGVGRPKLSHAKDLANAK